MRAALYLRCASIEPPSGVSPHAGDDRPRGRACSNASARRAASYPLRNADAWNAQGRIEWKPVESSRLYASVSSRARFPTLFERFSTQFGTAASNPGLNAQRATNYELGGSHAIGALTVTAALFYSDINNAIVAVRPAGFPANTSQRRNLGSADYYGGEIGIVAAGTVT